MTKSMDPSTPDRSRSWGALAGIVLGIADVYLLTLAGVRFEWQGQSIAWFVCLWFGSSFAILGWLVAAQIASRRRERRTAEIIREQSEAIQTARTRLAQNEKLAALGQLAAAIAHEVRNPLAVIRSSAQNLAESAVRDEEATRACSFIIAEIDRLARVVNSLLAFARPVRVDARAVAPGELVERAALLAGEDLQAHGIRLRRDVAPGLPVVQADPDLLCQVLLGLLSNAATAAGDKGEIALEAHAVDGAIELAVADSGPGVPAELRGKIFDAFFTTRTRGVGLGLAVAREIVTAHGGRIEVGERPGGGARFAVRLPIAAGAVA
jgi:signal transduction histidine kinase